MGFCGKGIKWMGVVSNQGFDHPEHKWFSLRDPSGQWDPMRAADEALGAYTEERGTQDHVSPSPAVEKKPSLRSKRATRGHKLRENLRLWTDDFHLAARVFRLREVSLFRIFFSWAKNSTCSSSLHPCRKKRTRKHSPTVANVESTF